MSSEAEKLLSHAFDVFNAKLSDRQVIKLEGMEDYLKVPQYKALVNLEKKASQLEVDAVMRIMTSRIAYCKAVQELRDCEKHWLNEIRMGMDSLEERNRIIKDVNTKMRKGDYSVLQPSTTGITMASEPSPRNTQANPPTFRKPEAVKPALPPEVSTVNSVKPELSDIKKRIAMMNITMDTPSRPPLHTINMNKHAEITSTPKAGPFLSSKGSLDGSVVPSRAPMTPLSASKWDVPAPNFDDTIDTEPIKPTFRVLDVHRPLPSGLLKSSDDEKEEGDDTFPLSRPSMPFRTPTVPHSRPFMLSSLRKEATKQEEAAIPIRPCPTPISVAPPPTVDPLSSLGLMKLKRPVLNSDVGKKLMGQL